MPELSTVSFEGLSTVAMDRIKAEDQDHYERTRLSLNINGYEIGRVKPTRQTEARLRPDPLIRLIENQTLSRERGAAAIEIREVYQRICAGLFAKCSSPERVAQSKNDIPERIALLHANHYKPWAYYLGGTENKRGKCPVALDITVSVVIDGEALSGSDLRRGWRNSGRTSLRYLAYALSVYADIAGWERNRGEIAGFEAGLRRGKLAA